MSVSFKKSATAAESTTTALVGTSVSGVVAGVVAALLVVGILYGSWKLKHSCTKSFIGKYEGER